MAHEQDKGGFQYDSQSYLSRRYDIQSQYRDEFVDFPAQQLHKIFSTVDSTRKLSILDYGCGPVPMRLISAATKASEIVFADYAESNIKHLQAWMEGDPKTFDWSPHFDYVVQTLEGGTESEARQREMQVRQLTKAVVSCDLTQDNPIQEGYEGPYDVIICSLCIGTVAKTTEEYSAYVGKLRALLKPKGMLIIYKFEAKTGGPPIQHYVGGVVHCDLPVHGDFLKATFEKHGFGDIRIERYRGRQSIERGDKQIGCICISGTLTAE